MKSTMMDTPLLVSGILRHGAAMHGDSEVVTHGADGIRRASFREVAGRAGRLANALRSLGISGDERVATFMWNNQEHLEAYLAVPSMAAVLHPLNIRLFPDQLSYIAKHAEDQVVILDASLIDLFDACLEGCKTVHTVVVVGDGDASVLEGRGRRIVRHSDLLACFPPEFDWPEVDERSAAAMCYTSGTTGDPKGVAYSHRSIVLHSYSAMHGSAFDLQAHNRVLPVVPMFHAQAWGIPYAAFAAGASLVLPDRHLQPPALVSLIESERPDRGDAATTIWNDLLHWLRANPGHDVSSLTRVFAGGSAVPASLVRACAEELSVHLVLAWGMTETSPLGSVANPSAGAAAIDWQSTSGRFSYGVEGRIVDDSGAVLPAGGSVGEIQVRGPWVTGSYYGGTGADRFTDGWLRTGDVGHLNELGYLTLTDRAKDVIKSGGEWISSIDLERAIAEHPSVAECAVVGVPDERWQERPLAVVVAAAGCVLDAQSLRGWLSDRAARWWLPERWAFVDAVPRTSVGKYDKKTIRRQYDDGALSVTTLSSAG